jgi:hypothetical protein
LHVLDKDTFIRNFADLIVFLDPILGVTIGGTFIKGRIIPVIQSAKDTIITAYTTQNVQIPSAQQSTLNDINTSLYDKFDNLADAIDSYHEYKSPISSIQLIQTSSAIINRVAFDSTGTYMAVCDSTPAIKLYKKQLNGVFPTTPNLTLTAGSNVSFVIFDDMNNLICATTGNGIQKFTRNIDTDTYQTSSVQINATNNVTKMAMDSSGKYMVTLFGGGQIQILVRQASGTYAQDSSINNDIYTLGTLAINPTAVTNASDITISKKGTIAFNIDLSSLPFAVGTRDAIIVYNPISGDKNVIYVDVDGLVKNLDFDDEHEMLAAYVNTSSKVILYKKNSSSIYVKDHEITIQDVVHMTFDPTGIFLAIACTNGKIYVLRKQGNLKFIFSKLLNKTIELSYQITPKPIRPPRPINPLNWPAWAAQHAANVQQWLQNIKNISVKFKPKTRDLAVSSNSQIKIFKKIGSEEPTRFQSPSPQGTDTYLKFNSTSFDRINVRIDFPNRALRDVLKSTSVTSDDGETRRTPVLDVSTIILDCASGFPEFLIIEEDKESIHSGNFRFKAITLPDSPTTPVLAFSITTEPEEDGAKKTFYILTNTIDFQSFTIINDTGEDVMSLPDNLGIPHDKKIITEPVPSLVNADILYKTRHIEEILLTPAPTDRDSIQYNNTTKTLNISTSTGQITNLQCDMNVLQNKLTFVVNSVSPFSPVSPVSPVSLNMGDILLSFIRHFATNSFILTYVNRTLYTNLNLTVSTRNEIPYHEKTIVYTKNDPIDTPFYYKLSEVDDPTNPYLDIDENVMVALKSISDVSSTITIPYRTEELLLYLKSFKSSPTNYVEFLDDTQLRFNGTKIFRYYSINGIIIFRDKYGTVNTFVFENVTTPQRYTRLSRRIESSHNLRRFSYTYEIDQNTPQCKFNYYQAYIDSQGQEAINMNHRILVSINLNKIIVQNRPTTGQSQTWHNEAYISQASTLKFIRISTDSSTRTKFLYFEMDLSSGTREIKYYPIENVFFLSMAGVTGFTRYVVND